MALGVITLRSGFENGIAQPNGGVGDFTEDLVKGLVRKVKIETVWGPPIDVDVDTLTAPSSGGFDFGKLLKPKVSLQLSTGQNPIVIAPYGEPGPNHWPWVAFGLSVVGGLALYGIFALIRGRK